MKTNGFLKILILLICGFNGWLLADKEGESPRPSGTGLQMIPAETGNPTSDRTSDAELIAKRAAASSVPLKERYLTPKPASYGLLELSSILANEGSFVILPKGSILVCPAAHQAKLTAAPTGQGAEWNSFLSANRNWLRCHEVSYQEIIGEKAIPEAILEKYRKENLVIIATQQGNPVTVLSTALPAAKATP